jgi:uncharacterized protein (DUF4415 family)
MFYLSCSLKKWITKFELFLRAKQIQKKGTAMKKELNKSANDGWRPLTAAEKKKFKKAYENTFGKVGRPLMAADQKKVSIHIKLDQDVIKLFKDKSKKTGRPYQTLINEFLKKAS